MKTATFGKSQGYTRTWEIVGVKRYPRDPREDRELTRDAATHYVNNRLNGLDSDSGPGSLRFDGRVVWEQPNGDTSCVLYYPGPGDEAYMIARDRNYVFRLEREGRLDQVEPRLSTQMPWLWREVVAAREASQRHLGAVASTPTVPGTSGIGPTSESEAVRVLAAQVAALQLRLAAAEAAAASGARSGAQEGSAASTREESAAASAPPSSAGVSGGADPRVFGQSGRTGSGSDSGQTPRKGAE